MDRPESAWLGQRIGVARQVRRISCLGYTPHPPVFKNDGERTFFVGMMGMSKSCGPIVAVADSIDTILADEASSQDRMLATHCTKKRRHPNLVPL